ncbi:dihydropyrimidinase [Clostridioides difficile]|uniref:dihydropyrimidinase n=1 Tax=Clostridioides difficile TaxID=1496 RepID=UPI000BB1841E|nr:dihydropyrimidinase [Clostridioides difficile]EGT5272000.1 dihydropyrimidinase [Clostridioides difficile]EGT5468996.1 dihydropyrimidinase [Clostridioides difficile]MBH8090910.1 dihydropyrimidinase [Clostridioides difficile]MBY1607457.1 dihydropyrimidinase [Clostridioides difficile]MBY2080043.1 dihydropyrimidinase [Clostridioides difficile]
MGTILRGGTIITSDKTYISDLRIEDEKIVEIGNNLEINGDKVIDATGKIVIPGGIDTHTHFDMNAGSITTADNFETGTRAAIAGGTTTILDFAEANEGENLLQGVEAYHKKASGNCYCDYGFHMTITCLNKDTFNHMEKLISDGIVSFKMYMAYDGMKVDDGTIYRVLKKARDLGCIVGFHCENGDLLDVLIEENIQNGNLETKYHPLTRPNIVEKESVSRLADITKLSNSKSYVVHLSCRESLETVKMAREKNIDMIVETCPQYLLLEDNLYNKDKFEGAKYVMSPPLRKKEDINYLWEGLSSGDIQTVGTDHCSFNFKGQKDLGIDDFSKIPNGTPGVEHRLALLYTYGVLENRISVNKFVEVTSTNAAKIFGMYPKKGEIAVGSDADIVILNINKEETISYKTQKQNVDYTPYEGFKVKCKVEDVFLRGNHVVQSCNVKEHPTGQYIKRKITK